MLLATMLPIGWAQSKYSMVDLEALEKERSFKEFFAHALDIRPSERTEYWQTMTRNMGEEYLKSLLQKLQLDHGDYLHMEELTSWPALKNYEFWRLKRQEVAMRWFQQCLKQNPTPGAVCWQDLVNFWEADRQEPDLAIKILHLVTPYLAATAPNELDPTHKARALVSDYFILAPLLRSNLSELHCKKPEVQKVVWNKLTGLYRTNFKSEGFTQLLNQVANKECWIQLEPLMHGMWERGASSDELTLAYLVLRSQNALTAFEQDLFQVTYLLTSPGRGEMMNRAWARLKELSSLPKQRDQILAHLKRWHPLPGDVFGDLDPVKKRALARHFKQNFPEYLDLYAHTCLDYFGGKRSFPEGNPAIYCRELFDLSQTESGLLPQSLIESFKASL